MSGRFKIGDKVRYLGTEYTVEKEYECGGVFFIGNDGCFCDMIPDHMLTASGETDEERIVDLQKRIYDLEGTVKDLADSLRILDERLSNIGMERIG